MPHAYSLGPSQVRLKMICDSDSPWLGLIRTLREDKSRVEMSLYRPFMTELARLRSWLSICDNVDSMCQHVFFRPLIFHIAAIISKALARSPQTCHDIPFLKGLGLGSSISDFCASPGTGVDGCFSFLDWESWIFVARDAPNYSQPRSSCPFCIRGTRIF